MNKLSQTIPYQVDTIFSPFPASEFPSALAFLEEAGFTGVELAIAYPREVNAASLHKQLQAHHLAATSLSTGQIYGLKGLYMSSFDEEIRKQAADVIKGHIELSAELDAPVVTVGLIRGKLEAGDPAQLMENFRCAMMPCVEYALKYGVTLQVEPINKSETVMIHSTYDGLAFLEALGNPENVGILYDTYHSNLEDGDMFAAIRAAAGRITNVHLADSHRGLPGYGTLDFKAIYRAVQETGYQGPYALETLAIPDTTFVNTHCFESVRAIMQ